MRSFPGQLDQHLFCRYIWRMGFELEKYYYKGQDIFGQLPPAESALISKNIFQKSIKKKKLLFKQGSHPAGVYVLISGKVKLYQVGNDEKETVIYFYTAGDIMGYRPIICNESHPLSAEALEDCTYSFIPRAAFLKILAASPSLSNLLLENLGHEFSVWVNNMSLFASQSVKERIAMALIKLNEIYKPEGAGQSVIRLSRSDFSAYVGTANETLVRLLGDLKRKKIIAIQGKNIRVLQLEALLDIIN
jgi:CRP-like cAMP-binding protein